MLTALASTPLAAHAFGPYGYGYGPGFGHFGFPWFALVIPVFWIAIIVLAIVFGRRRWRRNAAWRQQNGYPPFGPGPFGGPFGGPGRFGGYGHPGWGGASSAEQTLADRFARGDIDEVEYRARLEVLRASNERPGPVA